MSNECQITNSIINLAFGFDLKFGFCHLDFDILNPTQRARLDMDFTNEIKFDENGLMPVIIQDWKNNQVLMLAYMNAEALQMTVKSGKTHFWSRSRKQFWLKGGSSGHTQEVQEIFFDCDSDTILMKVEQKVAACHEGYRSCFFRKLENDTLVVVEEKIFNESEVYGRKK
jgi:phosphoribosyl-AMP cyclohydrolase